MAPGLWGQTRQIPALLRLGTLSLSRTKRYTGQRNLPTLQTDDPVASGPHGPYSIAFNCNPANHRMEARFLIKIMQCNGQYGRGSFPKFWWHSRPYHLDIPSWTYCLESHWPIWTYYHSKPRRHTMYPNHPGRNVLLWYLLYHRYLGGWILYGYVLSPVCVYLWVQHIDMHHHGIPCTRRYWRYDHWLLWIHYLWVVGWCCQWWRVLMPLRHRLIT